MREKFAELFRYQATPVDFESAVYRKWAGGSGGPNEIIGR